MPRFILLALLGFLGIACGESADRAAAEWALRRGGAVVLEGLAQPVTELAGLSASYFVLGRCRTYSGSRLDANDALEYFESP